MNPKTLFSGTADAVGDKVSVDIAGLHIIAIAADADFGGGTLTIKLYDHATSTELKGDAAKYEFTDTFEAFTLFLAPGMAVEATLAGATNPDISGVFMYPTER